VANYSYKVRRIQSRAEERYRVGYSLREFTIPDAGPRIRHLLAGRRGSRLGTSAKALGAT